MTQDVIALLQREGDDDPYVLRGFLFCELCSGDMVPVLVDTGNGYERHYACQSGQCIRPFMLAEAIEAAAWTHFALLNEAMAEGVAPDKRRAVMRPILRRVRLGDDINELWYEWND
jgi:hypothetical protein